MRRSNQTTPDEDAPLLLSWYRGDLSAFESLIWKYQKRIFNLALLLTGAQKTAGEVTENSFVAAYQNISTLKSTGRFSSWLVALALKECRERDNYRGEEADSPAEFDQDFNAESSYTAALQKKLQLCIRELPLELSELILLRYVRGYPLDRIEEILQISTEMVLSRLFEAQERLACWLKSGTEDPAEFSTMKTVNSSIHPEIRRNFSAYLDSSTENDEKELIKVHLASCGSCREALAELEWMIEDIKGIPDAEPPHWLVASIITKVKNPPPKPVKLQAPSNFNIQFTLAALFIAVIGASAYFLQRGDQPGSEQSREDQPVSSPFAEKNVKPPETVVNPLPKGVLRGAETVEVAPKAGKSDKPSPSFPLPTALPSDRTVQATPATIPGQPATATNNERIYKREKPAATQPGLQEWGNHLPQSPPLQKKASLPGVQGAEISVVLSSPDSLAVAHDIEAAVLASGGKVNGRAHSGGTDILYTSVGVERFPALMGRLGKIAKIRELPELPEGAEGVIDLVIRW